MNRILRCALMLLCLAPFCAHAPACADAAVYDDLAAACRSLRAAVYDYQTHIAFSLTENAVAGRSQSAIRDILTDVLEGYIDYTIDFSQRERLLDITIDGKLRPALNILYAWETGNRSALTADEAQCMDIALGIVHECRQGAASALDVERAIYDAICKYVDYFRSENPPKFGSSEYIRLHTSIGALLDGHTQCLGYSEVFYLLGRLAGLNVEMQYGFPGGSAKGKHAWNTVRIGKKTYMLDVCWGDTAGDLFEKNTPDYRYFNVGLDLQPQGRHPHPEAQIAEISAETSWEHTAFGLAKGCIIAATLEEAVKYGVAQHNAGKPYAHILIENTAVSLEDVTNCMWKHVKEEGIQTLWGRAIHPFADGTYVIFRWVFE